MDDLKCAILKAAAAATPGTVHKINLVGRPSQVGHLELTLNVRFDADERALAARAFDELRSAGHIRSTYSDLADPENWVEITESGHVALSTGSFQAPATREYEQKFGILWSPGQAERDFKAWTDQDRAAGRPVTVVYFDIDHFKALNTKYTETIVDHAILRPFQQQLRDICDSRGEAYRHGGDEFIVLLRNCGPEEGAAFAERLRRRLGEALFEVRNETVGVTVSIGVATSMKDAGTYEEALGAANKAKNQAKATRNAVCLTQSGLSDAGEPVNGSQTASAEEIEKVIPWFEGPDIDVRRDAARELLDLVYRKRVFHYEPMRGAIRRLMKDPDEEVRFTALEILFALIMRERASVGRYYAQPLITVSERDPSPRVRSRAMSAIGATGDTYYCQWIYVWIARWPEEDYRQAYPIPALIGLANSGLGEKIRTDLRSLLVSTYDATTRARLGEALKAVSNQ